MPVGKYYCDYCDKEFKDTAAARKRHLQGIHHHRNRKRWYDSLSLPQDVYQTPLTTQAFGKGLCNRFLKTGFCPYGDSCKHHHPKHNLQGSITQGTSSFADNMQLQTERFQGRNEAMPLSKLFTCSPLLFGPGIKLINELFLAKTRPKAFRSCSWTKLRDVIGESTSIIEAST